MIPLKDYMNVQRTQENDYIELTENEYINCRESVKRRHDEPKIDHSDKNQLK
jgi:hypothetical protein